MRTKCDIYVFIDTMDVLLNEAETDDLLYLIFSSIQFKTYIHILQSYKKQNCRLQKTSHWPSEKCISTDALNCESIDMYYNSIS